MILLKSFFYLALVGGALVLSSCQNEDIVIYRIPKENLSLASRPPAQKGLSWQVPPGWRELPPTSMRLGNFLITGAGGDSAEVTIVALSGEAGSLIDNVNRWREQIGLPPLQNLQGQQKKIISDKRQMTLVEFFNTRSENSEKSSKGLVALVYPQKNRTWFFKLMGDGNTVKESRMSFLKFVQGVKIAEPE